MSFLFHSLRNQCLFSFKFCFRNVKKLKIQNMFYSNVTGETRKLTEKYSLSSTFLCTNSSFLRRKNFDWIYKHYSRWTKYSKSGYFVNYGGKKKDKHSRFSDKVRLKFQSSKLVETKRRVKRKIVEIKENILTVPNALCGLRIVSTPILAYLIISEFYSASLGLFIFAGFTDLIDGYIARNFPNQQTMIGSFLDPAADKLLIATLFIALTINGLIPVPLTTLIILRDSCLMGAGFYIRYVSLPPPKTLKRYFDMSFATAKLKPTAISKANTLVQLSLAAASLAAPVFCFVDHFYLHMLWYVTGTTTVLSAASYLYYQKATYKLFTDPDKRNNK